MGRPSMSAEAIRSNKITIINAAMDMMHENGSKSISARSLGSRIGMNSALIYRYFRDIDEVILFACVHALRDYSHDMASARQALEGSGKDPSDEELYILSWELFSRHAFDNPEEYNILFFSRHSADLQNVIKSYYELFPEELSEGEDDIILQAMFRTANLRNRNLIVLIPVLEGKRTESEIILLNDMTISYFYALLVQLAGREAGVTADSQTERMMNAVRYTLRK